MTEMTEPTPSPDDIQPSAPPIDEVKAMTLWQRVFAIQAEGTRVEKKGRNDQHQYTYARASDVVATAQRLFTKWRVIPRLSFAFLESPHPEKFSVTRLVATLVLVNPDAPDDQITWGTFPGAGQDAGDKGPYKAMTGAAKYAFISACLFEPTDDPEDSGKPGAGSGSTGQRDGVDGEQAAAGRLSSEMPKDSNAFWKEVRAAGLFQVAKEKVDRQHMTWQDIWHHLAQPSTTSTEGGNGSTPG